MGRFVPDPVHAGMSKNDFLDLFTDAELEAFLDIDSLPAPAKKPMRVVLKRFEAADTIDLASQRTIDLVNGLVALGVLTGNRAAEILGAA